MDKASDDTNRREIGLQFTFHIYEGYSLPNLLRIIRLSVDRYGFDQVWINDNLGFHQVYVALAALASSRLPASLGTSVTNPYARNPIDVAATFASLAQVMGPGDGSDGREVGVGIARGARNVLGQLIETPKPISMMREVIEFVRVLLDGGTASFDAFPELSAYHHLMSGQTVELGFRPPPGVELPIYCAAGGPLMVDVAGTYADGIIFGTPFKILATLGKLDERLQRLERARGAAPGRPFKRIAQINLSVATDEEQAKEFARPFVAHTIVTTSDEDLPGLGVDPAAVRRIRTAYASGAHFPQVASWVSDAMVEALFVVGTPDQCNEQLAVMIDVARRHGFDQVYLAKLGPDVEAAVHLIGRELLPELSRTWNG